MRKIVLFALLLSLTSCKQMILFVYGIHNPRVVSAEEIEKNIKKYKLNADYNIVLSEEGFLKYYSENYSINELFIYTQNGKLVLPKDTNTCSSNTQKFVQYYNDSSLVNYADTTELNSFNQYFMNLDGSKVTIATEKPYVAVVFWASYTGRLNKDLSANWVGELKKDKDILVVCVNLDVQENWKEIEIK